MQQKDMENGTVFAAGYHALQPLHFAFDFRSAVKLAGVGIPYTQHYMDPV